MAYLIQELRKEVDVNTETFRIITDIIKKRELEAQHKVEKRIPIRVWVYDNLYFHAFYTKHCMGEGKGEFTLLVDNEGNQIPIDVARKEIETAIQTITNIKERTHIQKIKGFKVVSYHPEVGMTSNLREGFWVFWNT